MPSCSPSPFGRIYVDTSVWIALLAQETTAPRISAWMMEGRNLCTANWSAAELASALAIKARRGEFDAPTVADLCARYAHLLSFDVLELPILSADMSEAARLCQCPENGLRAGDALHLAIALRLRCRHFFSLDKTLSRNAEAFGLQLIEI